MSAEDDPFQSGRASLTEDDTLQALLPSKLSHTTFSLEFNVNAFLLSRRHVPIEDLRTELKDYLQSLRQELIGVINQEYEDFLGLGIGLRGTEVRLSRIKEPIAGFQQEIENLNTRFEQAQIAIEDKLREREDIREQKATLKLLLSVHESVLKVEALLLIPSAENAAKGSEVASTKSMGTPSQRIERVAAEYNQLLYLVKKAEGAAFISTLEPRIENVSKTLTKELAALLASNIQAHSTKSQRIQELRASRDSLLEILRTYQTLSKVTEAESVIRQELVRPFVSRIIRRSLIEAKEVTSPLLPVTPSHLSTDDLTLNAYQIEPISSSALSHLTTDLNNEGEALLDLYNKLLVFISKDVAPYLEAAEKRLIVANQSSLSMVSATPEEGVQGTDKLERQQYHLLANVVWDEIASRLISELGHLIFASGQPDIFHRNYVLTNLFLAKVESCAVSLGQLQTLRSHPTYEAFQRKWQLPVYYQLRFKDIVTRVEKVLAAKDASSIRTSDQFLLPATEAIHLAIWQIWQRNIIIEELVPRFWRLTLQLLVRYRIWLEQSTAILISPSASSPTSTATNEKGSIPSRSATPVQDSDEATLRLLTVHIVDILRLAENLVELYNTTIKSMMPVLDDVEDSETPLFILQESLSSLTQIIPKLSSSIISILVKACAEPLRSVKPVASQIRASSKRLGSSPAPSYFVGNIVKPCKDYENGAGKLIGQERKAVWFAQVISEVASRYSAILQEMKKTDSYLAKLKKGRQGFSSFFGSNKTNDELTAKEEDKVKIQMTADVAAFAQDAQSSLNLQLSECPQLQALLTESQQDAI